MLVQDLADFGKIARWRDHHAASAHNRFGEHRGNGVRSFGNDQRIQFIGAASHKRSFTFTGQAAVIKAGRTGMFHKIEWQAKSVLCIGKACQTGGSHRHAMIATLPADDLALFGLTARCLKIPGHFDCGIIGL